MHVRALAAFLVACALAAIAAFPLASAASAAAPRSAQAQPSRALGDQVVRVTWQHFRPTTANGTYNVSIVQCIAQPTSLIRDCNTAETYPLSLTGNQAQGTTQKDGTGNAFIDIETTARLPMLACSETHPCSLLLYENTPAGFDTEKLPPDRAMVPLSFRKSSGDCPPVTHFDVQIESESSAATAFYQWSADVCTGIQGAFTVDVTNTSSDDARGQFFAGNVDVAGTSLPPQPAELAKLPPPIRPYTVTPVDLTATVFAYNIFDPVTKQQITDLTLSPRLVARLVSSSEVITLFNDPEFKKLNPHHHFPVSASEAGVRAESNADTWIVTNWLQHDTDARRFLDGRDKYGIAVNPAWRGIHYPTDIFEARNPSGSYLPRTGEENVALKLFHSTKPADGVSSQPIDVGFIGVLDLPTALRFGLPTARLTTRPGKPPVAATVAGIQAGYRTMTPTAKGFYVMPNGLSTPGVYPLTKVDHAMAPTEYTSDLTKQRVEYLLAYAKGPGQDTLPPGFIPFPEPPVPTTTTTTTPTTTPTTFPSPSSVPPGGGSSLVPGGSSGYDGTTGPGGVGPNGGGDGSTPTTTGGGAARVSTPKLALISATDGLAFPIILGLGGLALLYLLGDLAWRRGPGFVASLRSRIAARGSGGATAQSGAST